MGLPEVRFYPGISYFICFSQTNGCHPDRFVQCLQQHDMDMDVSPIQMRLRSTESKHTDDNGNSDIDRLTEELCDVLKDHNSVSIQNLVKCSFNYCYTRTLTEFMSDWSDKEKNFVFGDQMQCEKVQDPRLTKPVRLVLVNKQDFAYHTLENNFTSLTFLSDKNSTELTSTIDMINKTVVKFQKPLVPCNGMVYVKPPKAAYTFIEMMDPSTYLNKLLSNETLKHGVLRNLQILIKLMSNSFFDVFARVHGNFDLIVILRGKCFKISERLFVDNRLSDSEFKKVSPRMFVEFDPEKDPEPLYFREGILNSFPAESVRVRFMNKFYECLMAGRMPDKIRKLLLCGPKDSGKTSWVQVLFGIIPLTKVAAITQEKQFSAAMMNEHTELLFLDEWSENTLQAKVILQGGYMVTCIKHQSPKTLVNKPPFYITTNDIPMFGSEDENVKRRVEMFETKHCHRHCQM